MKDTPKDIQERAVKDIPEWRIRLEGKDFLSRYIQGATDERELWMEFIEWAHKSKWHQLARGKFLKTIPLIGTVVHNTSDLFQLFLTTKTKQNEQ